MCFNISGYTFNSFYYTLNYDLSINVNSFLLVEKEEKNTITKYFFIYLLILTTESNWENEENIPTCQNL